MNYKKLDLNNYYREKVYRHFSRDCKCSISMTSRIDVTELYKYSKLTNTKFYINFLYLLCKVLNSRDDYKMFYDWKKDEVYVYEVINPTQYVFSSTTETCTPVYTVYNSDYKTFYQNALADIEEAKKDGTYKLDAQNHPNWFDASFIPWVSYDSFNVELPEGYLFFAPIVNWGKFRKENNLLMMPVTVRLNHAIADGYLISQVFVLLEKEIKEFAENKKIACNL